MKNTFWALATFIVFLALWQYVTAGGWISPILLPSPLDTARYLVDSVRDGTMSSALWVTMRRLVTGYSMGLLLGLLLGLVLYYSPLVRSTLGLAALGLQTLPSVCWAPLAILWFGQTEGAMYFVVIMGSVWGIGIGSGNALRAVPPKYLRAARVMGSRGVNTWFSVMLPAALPQILDNAKLGWAFAWRSLMSAEIYVTIVTNMGLGQLLHFGRELNAMDQVVAVMLIIIAVGLATDRITFVPAEKYLRRTRGL